ncbi:MAG: hypothetical protein ACE5GU_07575 [Candidatus Scalinduaceae bacterium]
MILTHVLKEKCPNCGNEGKYGNVNISSDTLNRGCSVCGQWNNIPLPPLKKDILYLDQLFLSHAFRNNKRPFVEAVQRIKQLASKQILVCPYSRFHTEETQLWSHDERNKLFEFIKQTARGHEFSPDYSIKKNQLVSSFSAFLQSNNEYFLTKDSDAFDENIHSWDDYYRVDIQPYLGDVEEIRRGKYEAVSALVDIFDGWRSNEATFEEDQRSEAVGYAKSLLNQYVDGLSKLATSRVQEYFNLSIESQFIRTLLYFDEDKLSYEDRIKRIKVFLVSDYFVNTPYIDISCQLFAVLRKLVRNGAYTNKEKAKEKLAGLYYDVDFISTYGPYCDAMFVDRVMMTWLLDRDAKISNRYSFSVFSAERWDEFHQYLNNFDEKISEEVDLFLKFAYPNQSRKV